MLESPLEERGVGKGSQPALARCGVTPASVGKRKGVMRRGDVSEYLQAADSYD